MLGGSYKKGFQHSLLQSEADSAGTGAGSWLILKGHVTRVEANLCYIWGVLLLQDHPVSPGKYSMF